MASSSCPVCGDPYHQKTTINFDTQFDNKYRGAFFDFMTNYSRRCSSRHDVELERYVSADEVVCYLHE